MTPHQYDTQRAAAVSLEVMPLATRWRCGQPSGQRSTQKGSVCLGHSPHRPERVKTTLRGGRGLEAAVRRYAPGERHPPHTDRWSRISFLLRGSYREETRTGTIVMRPGDTPIKSCEAVHENVFGDAGAVLVALEFSADDPFPHSVGAHCWRKREDPIHQRLLAARVPRLCVYA